MRRAFAISKKETRFRLTRPSRGAPQSFPVPEAGGETAADTLDIKHFMPDAIDKAKISENKFALYYNDLACD